MDLYGLIFVLTTFSLYFSKVKHNKTINLSVCLSVCQSVRPSVCLSVHWSVCPSLSLSLCIYCSVLHRQTIAIGGKPSGEMSHKDVALTGSGNGGGKMHGGGETMQ